uniref:ensconsin-like isoform X5 n=1 Tax=Oncorhynchus gorbuscha TaxID=8017 RepID=UPI001EAED649|nr:ensconsin-like isoform X5 [Oncorhynchus gorbuscha]
MADQDGSDTSPTVPQVSDSHPNLTLSSGPDSSTSGQALSTTPTLSPSLSPTPTHSNNAANKAEPLVLKINERQRLARERREEREKQIAVREAAWQEREERARHYYEKHLEERRRKVEEQSRKEDRRRSAVEEKRRQNLEEEKARHEAVMHRTVERSQRAKPNHWTWGGTMTTPTTPGDADRRSVSTVNLSKHAADPVITKRLSYSSATLLHSPDRGAMPACPRSVSCHPMGSMSFKSIQSQPLTVCRSQEPLLPRDMTNRRRTTGKAPDKNRDSVRKSWSNLSMPLTTPL